MAQESVLITEKFRITRPEGDDGCIVMTIPDYFDLTDVTVLFEVFTNLSDPLFIKSSAVGSGISINGQTIVIELLSMDTEGFRGNHNARVRLLRPTGKTTIGKGVLIID
jgi:hypothetical protein